MILDKAKEFLTLEALWELARFGIVGVAATLIHLSIALYLDSTTSINIFVINTLAFLCAFGMSFFGHYFWTFKSNAPKLKALIKFFSVALSGLMASSVMILMLIWAGLESDMLKLTISILIIPAVTYVVGKFWAFKS